MGPGLDGPTAGGTPGPAGERIGTLLTRLRAGRGQSQLRLAELLCAAAGSATVTRHEVSRWEREERIPSGYWLGWLAAVLEVPVEVLEVAAGRARDRRAGPPDGPAPALRPGRGLPDPATAAGPLAHRLEALHRMDDLVGGADLATVVVTDLRDWLGRDSDGGRGRLPAGRDAAEIAELAQLTSWVLADAGLPRPALRAARTALDAAPAGDRPLTVHLLGCLSEIAADSDRPGTAQRLVRAGSGLVASAPAGVQALALHRIAYAAARAGDRYDGEQTLLAAERAASRRRSPEPPWLYWLDELHLTALTGRCYAALGRPRQARALLSEALGTGLLRPRARALCGAWLGFAQASTGDLDSACEAGWIAVLAAVRSGSVRAARQVRALDAALRRFPTHPAVIRYAAPATRAAAYLPDVRGVPGTEPDGYAGDRSRHPIASVL